VGGEAFPRVVASVVTVVDSTNAEDRNMKKTWTKPGMCQVEAGMEISRYISAKIGK
jgi:hypothetical protein